MNSHFNSLTLTQKRLFVLLWNSLFGKPSDPLIFEGISHQDWKAIMELSAIQGVYALVFDGIRNLPSEYHPSRDLKIEWSIGIRQIENRYFQQRQVLKELTDFFKNYNIRCLLLKGIGYSNFYPVPEHRESGDLDIYLFGDFEKGNQLIAQSGIQVEIPDRGCVHSSFVFQNTKIENHRSFFPLDWQKDDVIFEEILKEKLLQITPVSAEDNGVYIPSLEFNLLFAYKHALKHFIAKGIVLRQFCDLALLLNQIKNPDQYQSFYETMKRFSLHNYVDAFNLLMTDVLALHLKSDFYNEKCHSLSNQILNDIFLQNRVLPILPRSGYFELLKGKVLGAMDLYQRRWKYQAVNNKMFQRELGLRLKISVHHFKELKP